jgi:hypothetical protein
LKAVITLLMMVAVCACQKQLPAVPKKNLHLDEFNSMLARNDTYVVTRYYTSRSSLDIPTVNADDTYTFDGPLSDGWITSVAPCIEYHYNIKAFTSGDDILFDWLDFSISPTTFVVEDYKPGEWFVIRAGDVYTRYEVRRPQQVQ